MPRSDRILTDGAMFVALVRVRSQFYVLLHNDESILGGSSAQSVRRQLGAARVRSVTLESILTELTYAPRVVQTSLDELRVLLGEPFTMGQLMTDAGAINAGLVPASSRDLAERLHAAGALLWS